MQKINFDNRFGLTQAVLEGLKTNTRRLEKGLENLDEGNFYFNRGKLELYLYGDKGSIIEIIKPRYKIGEVVAVAQSYGEVYNKFFSNTAVINSPASMELHTSYILMEPLKETIKGWNNKMFVKSSLMPHQIRITDIKVERLQDISGEDCLKEGIRHWRGCEYMDMSTESFWFPNDNTSYSMARQAFAALIDKVSGKGTWKMNPFVFAYEFELVK